MADPTHPAIGTGTAGTYYFLDRHIARLTEAQVGVIRAGAPDEDRLKVLPSGTPSMVLQVNSGNFRQGDLTYPVRTFAGGSVTVPTADPDYTRVDLITVTYPMPSGPAALVVTPGTVLDNSMPVPVSTVPTGGATSYYQVPLALVVVYPGTTAITDQEIYDRRGPLPFTVSGDQEMLVTGTVNVPTSPMNGLALFDGGGSVEFQAFTGRPKLASGVVSVGAINLASEVTGDLPLSSLAQASAASRILLRGAASGAGDWQEGTLGSGLALTGTVLSATGGGTGDVVGPSASVDDEVVLYSGTTGKLIKRASATGRPKLTAGVQSVGAIDLAAEVTGDLPYANLVQATAASRLLGRGSASGAGDWQEVTLGAGLSMSGTALSASGGSTPYVSQSGTYNTDTTDRALLSFTVPGGTLGADQGLLFFLTGSFLFNSGTPTWTLRIKLGATTLMGDVTSSTFSANVVRRALVVWGILTNVGATNVQRAVIDGYIGQVTAGSVAGTMDIAVANTATFALITGHGSGAEDTTSDKVFAISSQFNVSNVAVELSWKGVAYLTN